MALTIKTINPGGVNCYLVNTGQGFILIDTGFSMNRRKVEKELEDAGCQPGNLKLIVLTHADSDHSGNCAYLRARYKTQIAIHPGESKVVRRGDMILSRKHPSFLAKIVLPFFRLRPSDRFTPDLYVEDGQDLSSFGLDARVLHLPGHSAGSIGILTSGGDLFCGDLLEYNGNMPNGMIIDDREGYNASIQKLKKLKINTVYPGHGKSFRMDQFMKSDHSPDVSAS